eukprot:7672278-Ditylum_brightwellii.AAC.1
MRKQVRRPRTAQCLLNALQRLRNTFFPRRPTRRTRNTFGTSVKPLLLGSCKWILRMIKLNNYLEFPQYWTA